MSDKTMLGALEPDAIDALVSRREAIAQGARVSAFTASALALGSVPIALGALATTARAQTPTGTIIDVLQYREFWERVRDEIDRVVDALRGAGVLTKVHYDPVADGGEVLTRALLADEARPVSGDAILRIDGRCARFPRRGGGKRQS